MTKLTGRPRDNLINKSYGRLMVFKFVEVQNKNSYWDCFCSCGNRTTVRGSHLKAGIIKSCGCLNIEARYKHERCFTSIYHRWAGMIQRCTNPNHTSYKDYGGRGITICESWFKFENFYADMGDPPEELTLDRIDNNGNYEPSNCKWSTVSEQNSNQRRSLKYREV